MTNETRDYLDATAGRLLRMHADAREAGNHDDALLMSDAAEAVMAILDHEHAHERHEG